MSISLYYANTVTVTVCDVVAPLYTCAYKCVCKRVYTHTLCNTHTRNSSTPCSTIPGGDI